MVCLLERIIEWKYGREVLLMKVSVEKPTTEELQKLNLFSWPIWECQPSTFDWHYDEQETCYILEGKVTVETDAGSVSFEKGDLVVFPKGLSCKWVVHEKVSKHYKFG